MDKLELPGHWQVLGLVKKQKKSQFYFLHGWIGYHYFIYKEHFPKVSKKSDLILITTKDP